MSHTSESRNPDKYNTEMFPFCLCLQKFKSMRKFFLMGFGQRQTGIAAEM